MYSQPLPVVSKISEKEGFPTAVQPPPLNTQRQEQLLRISLPRPMSERARQAGHLHPKERQWTQVVLCMSCEEFPATLQESVCPGEDREPVLGRTVSLHLPILPSLTCPLLPMWFLLVFLKQTLPPGIWLQASRGTPSPAYPPASLPSYSLGCETLWL